MATTSGKYDATGEYTVSRTTYFRRSGDPSQPPSVTTSDVVQGPIISGTWSKSGVGTPGYGRGTARLKPLPYTFRSLKYIHQSGYKHSTPRSGNFTGARTGTVGMAMGVGQVAAVPANAVGKDIAMISRLTAEASTKLLKKLKSGTINVAVASAEAKKTGATIANAATRMYNAYRNLRRGNFGQAAEDLGGIASRRGRKRFSRAYAKDVERAVANGWLELQYGWKPLLNDVYGAAEALAKAQLVPMYLKETAVAKINMPLKGFRKSSDGLTTYYDEGYRETIVRFGVTYYRKPGTARTAAELGITNPLTVAWELVPFSFVADWFLPVGQALETLDATNGLQFLDGYRSTVTRHYVTYTQTTVDTASSVWTENNQSSGQEFVDFERVILSGFPSPTLPRFRNPWSTTRAASALALFSSIFRK